VRGIQVVPLPEGGMGATPCADTCQGKEGKHRQPVTKANRAWGKIWMEKMINGVQILKMNQVGWKPIHLQKR